MRPTFFLRRGRRIVAAALLGIGAVLLLLLFRGSRPVFGSTIAQFGEEDSVALTMPFWLDEAPIETLTVETTMTLPWFHPTRYVVGADDCLEEIIVNGESVESPLLPNCDYDSGIPVDLGPFLHQGSNTIELRGGNAGGGAGAFVFPSSVDSRSLAIAAVFFLLFLLFGFAIAPCPRKKAWCRIESVFLWGWLGMHLWLFQTMVGIERGFDVGAHLEMLTAVRWFNPFAPLYETFLSYHPPLGFLFPKVLHSIGYSSVVSVQMSSFLASILAFLFLRAALRHCGLLWSLFGIVLLYVSTSMPVQMYLATSINLDVWILAFAAAALFLSLRLFWASPVSSRKEKRKQHWFALALVMVLVGGMMTKFSGWVFLTLPLIVLLVSVRRGEERAWRKVILLVCLAVALVFPYYAIRYYRAQATFFPGNAQLYLGQNLDAARTWRDEHRREFFTTLLMPDRRMLLPRASDIPALRDHDYTLPRLRDTWKDLWIADMNPLTQTMVSMRMSLFYLQVVPWIVLAGLLYFLWSARKRRHRSEVRLGGVLLLCTCLFLLSLVRYAYQFPDAGFKPTKGIYVAPVTWAIGFLMAFLSPLVQAKRLRVLWGYTPETLVLLMVLLFVFFNHVIPVYV